MSGAVAAFGGLAGILRAASAIGDAVKGVANWYNTRQLIKAGRAEAEAEQMKGQLNEIREAKAAGDAVRTDIARNPDRLREDDGFKRKHGPSERTAYNRNDASRKT